MNLNSEYWENRYQEDTAKWDLGLVSPPIKEYIDQIEDKALKILIPGAGNSYEAEYLFHKGFKNVYVIDLAKSPLNNIKSRVPEFPDAQLLHGNFFDISDKFDLIIEQTFFCAIHPSLRDDYVIQAADLLNDRGKIVGLLFNVPLNEDHPPFGGHKKEYEERFLTRFDICKMESCTNSISSRKDRELFVNLAVKSCL